MGRSAMYTAIVACCALFVNAAFSLPRFALMQGTKCQTCHVNPTGGGMRNDFGTTYSVDKLPLEATKDDEFNFSGKLNDNISIGGDSRGQFIYDNGSRTTSFQAMTTAIYGSVHLNKKFYFYFKQDLVNSGYGPLNGPEVYGLAKLFSGGWYIKGGAFMPNYGWRVDDHTAYTRGGDLGYTNNSITQRGLIFIPNYKDIGAEIGGYLGGLFVTAGLFNGDGNQYQIHMTDKKAYALKAEYTGSLGDINYNIGASGYGYNIMSMGGVTLGFGFSDFTLLGEVDVTKNYLTGSAAIDTSNPGGNTMAAHVEAAVRTMQGVWFIGCFDIFDPIQGITENEIKRITVGLEFFPYPFVELRPQYRMNLETPGVNNDQMLVQMHLWF